MNTKIHKYSGQMAQAWQRHGHFVAAMLCGILIGSLFGSFVDMNQAAYVGESVALESPEVMSKAEQPIAESIRFTVVLDSSSLRQFALPSSVAVVKKGVQRVALVETVVRASSSQSAVSSSASDRVRERVRLPKPAPKPVVVIEQVPIQSSSSPSSSVVPVVQKVEQTESMKEGDTDFPAFGKTLHPVAEVPNWGAMRTPAEWNRTYAEMKESDFVAIPKYDLSKLTIPMSTLMGDLEANESIITAKLYYSTRYMGSYDLDAGEHSGTHPGIDLKLARGTLIGSVAGGRVYAIQSNEILGKHIIIEHRLNGVQYFSLYAHLDSYTVAVGDAVKPGQGIARVGMTGKTAAPHLHLEVRTSLHGAAGSNEGSLNPITFITTGGKGG